MHKFPINEYRKFEELPLDKLDALNFSIYVLDLDWNYLFMNGFARKTLGSRSDKLIGKNVWLEFPELAADAVIGELRRKLDKRIVVNVITVSPVNSHRINIVGYPLEDCLYCAASILPDKTDLLQELRNELNKKSKS